MRALIVEPGPAYSVDDVRRGLLAGLRSNGVEVASLNLGDRVTFYANAQIDYDGEMRRALDYETACSLACAGVKTACWDMAPEVVVIVSSFFIPPDLYLNLRQRGVRIVLWLTESPYEDSRQIPMAAYADTVIVNDPTNLDQFRAVNPNTHYIPHAYDPDVHRDRYRAEIHDFAFCGTGFASRVEFFEKVDWPCEPVFAGHWPDLSDDSPLFPFLTDGPHSSLDNAATADLYRASKTSANLYRKEALSPEHVAGWAMGPREVELAATRTWFARESRPEGDALFPMLPTFTEPGELAEQIQWALKHPDLREQATKEAQAAIVDRTFANNAAELLKLIGA